MKIYALATKIHQCYGHGDYGDDIVISITSGYDGSSCNPRIFAHKIDAERNATPNEIIVELDVIERGASDGELLVESDAWIP